MAKVLVADDARNIRALLVDALGDSGYEVMEAADGGSAWELALYEHPDVILLDVWMPVMDGFEVLRRLRENSATEGIPVILLTALSPQEGELEAMSLGVKHYITKPWEPGTVELALRIALREAGTTNGKGTDGDAFDGAGSGRVIRTGNMPLDQRLNGGIPLGSLTLVEGTPATGKSVLCQHLCYESLLDGHGVAYFTSDLAAKDLVGQMNSLGRDVSRYFREGKLGVYPVAGGATEQCDGEQLMALLARDIERLPGQYKIIIVDSVTDLVTQSQETAIMGFFSSCKRLGDEGRTNIVVARSYSFDAQMLNRLEVLCDAHLSLSAEKIGAKVVNMLEVRKVHNAKLYSGNTVSFEVVRGIGLRTVPGSKVKL